jgi:hypothetical protein
MVYIARLHNPENIFVSGPRCMLMALVPTSAEFHNNIWKLAWVFLVPERLEVSLVLISSNIPKCEQYYLSLRFVVYTIVNSAESVIAPWATVGMS